MTTQKISAGDWVSRRKPYRYISDAGNQVLLRVGRVEECLNEGRCFGLKFVECRNVLDFDRSLIGAVLQSADEIEAHAERHQNCPRCAGSGELPDESEIDGGTRLALGVE